MQEASIPSFIRTLLWIVIIYYVLKFLARLLFPIVIKKAAQKAEEQFKQHYQNQQDNSSTAQSSKSDKPKETKKVGEYIDYEEVE